MTCLIALLWLALSSQSFVLLSFHGHASDDNVVRFQPPGKAVLPPLSSKLMLFRPRAVSMTEGGEGIYSGSYSVVRGEARQRIEFELIEKVEGPPKLRVDDAPVEMKPDSNDVLNYSGAAQVGLRYAGHSDPAIQPILVSWLGKSHANRREGALTLLIRFAPYTQGEVALGGKTYKAALFDLNATGDFRGLADSSIRGVLLALDVNGNGKFDKSGEAFDIGRPFNIKGATYEARNVVEDGTEFKIVRSKRTVPEVLPPPDLRPGNIALGFKAKSTSGKSLSFPESYRGKTVALLFYASWCGDCRRETPAFARLFPKYALRGLEAIGISLDTNDRAEQMAEFVKANRMDCWPQTYSGKGWNDPTAQIYGIDWIPTLLLVDGDTGKILVAADTTSQATLEKSVEEALAKKSKR